MEVQSKAAEMGMAILAVNAVFRGAGRGIGGVIDPMPDVRISSSSLSPGCGLKLRAHVGTGKANRYHHCSI